MNRVFSNPSFDLRYWLVRTKDIGKALNQIKNLEGDASVVSYDAEIIIFARVPDCNKRHGELRICLVTDEYSSKKTLFDPSEGFVEVNISKFERKPDSQTLSYLYFGFKINTPFPDSAIK